MTYRLRDWLVSRQRAWGTPIPVVYCQEDPSCGIVPVPESDSCRCVLPDDFEFRPDGRQPARMGRGLPATRRVRSAAAGPARDRHHGHVRGLVLVLVALPVADKDDGPIDRALEKKWCPVDQYTGGSEHAVLHLLYARFFTKALNDLGLVHEREPWLRLFNQGQILGADGERMSKSRGNVQDPDDLVSRYGADTVRLFLMFMGPWDQGGPWSPTGIDGRATASCAAFGRWCWIRTAGRRRGQFEPGGRRDDAAEALRRHAHRTLAKVTEDHADFRWNTMISALMELTNSMYPGARHGRCRHARVGRDGPAAAADAGARSRRTSARSCGRAAPAAGGEEWRRSTPSVAGVRRDAASPMDDIELPVQVNGKLRDVVSVPAGLSEIEIEQIVLARDKVRAQLEGHEIVRVIHVPGRLVNVVVRPIA